MRYLLKKIMFFLITALVALTINFILPRMMPGDPATTMIAKFGGRIGPEALEAIKINFGLVTVPKKLSVKAFEEKVLNKFKEKKEKIMEKEKEFWGETDAVEEKPVEEMSERELVEKEKKEKEKIKWMQKIEVMLTKIEEEKQTVLNNFVLDKRGNNYILDKNISPAEKGRVILVFSSVKYKEEIISQYINYLKRVFTGNFGISTSKYPSTVGAVLQLAVPWTLGLVGIATIISFMFGTMLGVKNAWRRESLSSGAILISSLFLQALPYFWIAILLRYIFGFLLEWFPLYGAYTDRATGILKFFSIIYHGILPGFVVFIVSIGGWVLTMRNNMIGVLSDNYVSFAKAKGIPDRVVKYLYAARNAVLPSFTGFAMSLGSIIGGSLLTEIVFSYPGIGSMMFDAVQSLDYPLMQACFLLFTMGVLIMNFIVDLLYVVLDPRVRTGGEGA